MKEGLLDSALCECGQILTDSMFCKVAQPLAHSAVIMTSMALTLLLANAI